MHYLGVFALSTLLLQKIASRSKLWRRILIVVVVGVTALLSGLRAPSIGSDTSSYPLGCYKFASVSSHYANYDDHVSEFYFMKEIGYKVLAYVSTKIYNDFNFFLLFVPLLLMRDLCISFGICQKSIKSHYGYCGCPIIV